MKEVAVRIKKIYPKKVIYKLEIPKDLARYFRKSEFYIESNTEISKNPALLIIPAVSLVLPLAMVSQKSINVECIDKTFYYVVSNLSNIIQQMYPKFPDFRGIHSKELEEIKINGSNVALFYSGGVDSTALLIRHFEDKPYLITILGSDIPIWDRARSENVKKLAQQTKETFSCRDNIFITFENPLDMSILSEDFRDILSNNDWWGGIQAGITIPLLAAPVADILKLKTIYIARGIPERYEFSWGDRSILYNSLSFGDCKIQSDDGDLSRMDKIRIIKRHIENNPKKLTIRSCLNVTQDPEILNCGYCEKCTRTILELLVNGLDPVEFGFNVNYSKSLEVVKKIVEKGFSGAKKLLWLEIIEETQKIDASSFPKEAKDLIFYLKQVKIKEEVRSNDNLPSNMYRKLMRFYRARIPLNIRNRLCFIEDVFLTTIIKTLRKALKS